MLWEWVPAERPRALWYTSLIWVARRYVPKSRFMKYMNWRNCSQSDFPADLTGKIVLVSRGTCQSAIKIAYAGAANASGAIIYNVNNPLYSSMNGYSLQKTSTPEGPYVPTGGITKADGLDLVSKLDAGVEIIVDLSTETVNKTTWVPLVGRSWWINWCDRRYNVIAQTTGGDQDNVLLLGAHTDSIAAGWLFEVLFVGTICKLTIADGSRSWNKRQRVRYSFTSRDRNAITQVFIEECREIWLVHTKLNNSHTSMLLTKFRWTAEEPGLLGSIFYVANLNQSEIDKIRLVLSSEIFPKGMLLWQI